LQQPGHNVSPFENKTPKKDLLKNKFKQNRPDGWIYEKEAILEYILHKKVENARLLKEFQRQKEQNEKDSKEVGEAEYKQKVDKFLKAEGKLVQSGASLSLSASSTPSTSSASVRSSATPGSSDKSSEASASVSNMNGELRNKLPSFWIPSLVPESKLKTQMKKPDTVICCPMSGRPISMKDLTDVKFKLLVDKDDKRSLIAKTDRYVCAVTNDTLNNAVPCCVLRTS
jgi:nitric oxide synthase-interacting protein